MKKNIIYVIMVTIGTVGFIGCGPVNSTTQDRSIEAPQNQTATTGTSGTRTAPSSSGPMGSTTSNRGQKTATKETAGISQTTQAPAPQVRNDFRLNQPGDYSFNNENYRFTPDSRGINITWDHQGNQTPFGTMRSFGNDGYYMVTTINDNGQEEFSVGRFDESGNFTLYRYDRDGDRVTEQNYRYSAPEKPGKK